MNRINPEKLLQSKWTAVIPQNKEKHFIVTELLRDEQEQVTHCILQAVMTHQEYQLDWKTLKNDADWRIGWK
ncbi:MAG: TIGR02450 family Trp-rich protein [Oceanospirillales bacterium]|jgi:tryptophan-rich hypothetical protein|nr:MAG: TIGR02450 family Trp-rich protein [Oceanospirillales bacterium]